MNSLSHYGFSSRPVPPQGTGVNGVLILGEAPGEQEDQYGIPFCPFAPAGSVLERAIRRVGMTREQFVITNTVPLRPPKNILDGAHYEAEAVTWGIEQLDTVVAHFKPRCILALGAVALRAATGLVGPKLGISNLAGFVLSSPRYDLPVVASFHPSYLRRGEMSHLGVLMRAIKLATLVAKEGRLPIHPPVDNPPQGYKLYPTEQTAQDFALAVESGNWDYLAYDIETPYSNAEDSAEEHAGEILSIQFSLTPGSGIYFRWREPYRSIAQRILRSAVPKLSWNGWRFDDPRLRANGCTLGGVLHDLMWTWHHLQPDLPRGLQFACAQQGWPWPWKHLDAQSPEFYGIVDVDVLQWLVSKS